MANLTYAVQMDKQIGLNTHGLFVDLNCGWYCLRAVLAWAHQPLIAHPGNFTLSYHPSNSALVTTVNKPANINAWYTLLRDRGPIIVSGKLGAADWGILGGVGHYILIVGVDTTLDPGAGGRLFYKDPLQGDVMKHDTFNHLNARMENTVDYLT